MNDGGVLLTFGVASYFPAEFGIANVDAQAPAQGFLRLQINCRLQKDGLGTTNALSGHSLPSGGCRQG